MADNKIVILGAGFGGLAVALKLGRCLKKGKLKNAEIILIDQNKYHTYTPTLYEAVATSKDIANYIDLKSIITIPIDKIIKGLPIKFINKKITGLETDMAEVYLDGGHVLTYDYLVLAVGSEANFFDIKGLEENAFKLKGLRDALELRNSIWSDIIDRNKKEKLKIVIGGGGSTGVELASEIRMWVDGLTKEYNRETNVKIIEANSDILEGLSSRVAEPAKRRLKKIGVEIQVGAKITSVSGGDSKIIETSNGGKIPYDILAWTGGVAINKLLQRTSLKLTNDGLVVGEDMMVAPKIFAIGDIVRVTHKKTNEPVPLVARAAIDQAKVSAINIIRDIEGKPRKTYNPPDYPYIVAVGGKYAIAKIGPFVIKGFAGWILKGLVELRYLFSIMPKIQALKIWLKGLYIFIKNDRLG